MGGAHFWYLIWSLCIFIWVTSSQWYTQVIRGRLGVVRAQIYIYAVLFPKEMIDMMITVTRFLANFERKIKNVLVLFMGYVYKTVFPEKMIWCIGVELLNFCWYLYMFITHLSIEIGDFTGWYGEVSREASKISTRLLIHLRFFF